ncbi:hypothetical protein BH23BAC3_BH23BAC3_36350 [soil metagenome]
MNHALIYNTSAGRGSADKLIQNLCNDLIKSETTFTTIKITQFTKASAEELLMHGHINRVIICGGDGTVNRTYNQMDGFLGKVEIGIIPCGYGNLIAGSIDAPSSVESFVSESSQTRFNEVKIGQANNQYFLNVASIGLTADTVSFVEKFRQTLFGSAFYRTFGGLIIHILFFCITLVMKKTFNSQNNYPSSKAWLRTYDKKTGNTFLEFSDLRDMISQYKSLYLSGDRYISWNTSVMSSVKCRKK